MKRLVAPAVLLSTLTLTGCSSFRAVTRGAFNNESTGGPAPALDDGTWVDGTPDLAGQWYLVAFIKPT